MKLQLNPLVKNTTTLTASVRAKFAQRSEAEKLAQRERDRVAFLGLCAEAGVDPKIFRRAK